MTADVSPNTTGIPGLGSLSDIVGGMLTFGLVLALAALVISAAFWAVGAHSANPVMTGRGKTGVLVAMGASFLIGAANLLVDFFSHAGRALH